MTKSSDTGQDLVGRLRPHKRRRSGVAMVEVGKDGRFQRACAPVRATLDLFLGEEGKPAFDKIEPRAPGRGEVQVETWSARQPAMNHRRLVGAVVIENQVHC